MFYYFNYNKISFIIYFGGLFMSIVIRRYLYIKLVIVLYFLLLNLRLKK